MTIREITIAAAVAAALGVTGGVVAQTAPPPAAAPSTSGTPGGAGATAPSPGTMLPSGQSDRGRGASETTTPRMPGTMPGASSTLPGSTAPGATTGATTPGSATQGGGRLTPGANSFTEGQARSRISDAGFADVQGLRLDEQGIWRGRATRNGQQTGVALDFQGNVAATQ